MLRSTCRYMDAVILDKFGKKVFSRLFVMPTKFSLQLLLEVARDKRIKHFVKELYICCSIYQDCGSRYTSPGDPRFARANVTISSPRMLQENENPYPEPTSAEEEATNEAVDLVRRGSFQKQLTIPLQLLRITSLEIHTYWQMRYPQTSLFLVLGRSQLTQSTGRDSFEGPQSKPRRTWEYASFEQDGPMDMVTCMTNAVLSAIEASDTPLQNLTLPKFQIDKLQISPNLDQNLRLLQRLRIDIGLSVSRRDYHLFPSQLSKPNMFTMINDLPCLEHLELSLPTRAYSP